LIKTKKRQRSRGESGEKKPCRPAGLGPVGLYEKKKKKVEEAGQKLGGRLKGVETVTTRAITHAGNKGSNKQRVEKGNLNVRATNL